MTKNSAISIKRAAAALPSVHHKMLAMFLSSDMEMIERGPVGSDGPSPDMIFNCDEIGFDPDGKAKRTYSVFKGRAERRFLYRKAERAAFFWVSAVPIITASGRLLDPVFIHQGGGVTNMISKNFLLNLLPEASVTVTSSGYDDKEAFRIVVDTIRSYVHSLGPRKDHGVVYLDGHYSHFDVEALIEGIPRCGLADPILEVQRLDQRSVTRHDGHKQPHSSCIQQHVRPLAHQESRRKVHTTSVQPAVLQGICASPRRSEATRCHQA